MLVYNVPKNTFGSVIRNNYVDWAGKWMTSEVLLPLRPLSA